MERGFARAVGWAIAASTELDLCCCVAPAGEDHEDHPWEDNLAAPMGTAPDVIPANKSTIKKTRRKYHVVPNKECT